MMKDRSDGARESERQREWEAKKRKKNESFNIKLAFNAE